MPLAKLKLLSASLFPCAFFRMNMLQMFLDIMCSITRNKSVHVGKTWRVEKRLTYVFRAKTISSLDLLVDSFQNFWWGSVLEMPNCLQHINWSERVQNPHNSYFSTPLAALQLSKRVIDAFEMLIGQFSFQVSLYLPLHHGEIKNA